MEFLLPSFLAGALTVLAPCTVTLLPVMLSGSVAGTRRVKPLVVGGALGISVFVFTLLLKIGTDVVNVDENVLRIISSILLLLLGLAMLFPDAWAFIQVKFGLYKSEKLLEKAQHIDQKDGQNSDAALLNGTKAPHDSLLSAALMGAALGPVFSTCSPTYFFIIGTILPQDFGVGVLNLALYCLGLIAILLVIGYGGRTIVQKLKFAANPRGWFKRFLGVLLIVVGLLFLTGWDKAIEIFILDLGGDSYFLIDLERGLMGR